MEHIELFSVSIMNHVYFSIYVTYFVPVYSICLQWFQVVLMVVLQNTEKFSIKDLFGKYDQIR